jgi:phage baseplate assembly protein W
MAIKFKELENLANTYTVKGYLYKDLGLDLQQKQLIEPGYSTAVRGSDIKESVNLAAIQNSLQNLFNTLPGQRFLFPEYGLDIYQFLFSPINDLNARMLGEKIIRSIEIYEPRVIPRNVNITVDPDGSQYFLNITIEIPALNLINQTDFLLDTKKQSFIFVPNSRNN